MGSDVLAAIQELRAEVAELRTILLGVRDGGADPLLDVAACCAYLSRSRSWFYAARQEGILPPPDKSTGGRGGDRWRRSSVDAAIRQGGTDGQS